MAGKADGVQSVKGSVVYPFEIEETVEPGSPQPGSLCLDEFSAMVIDGERPSSPTNQKVQKTSSQEFEHGFLSSLLHGKDRPSAIGISSAEGKNFDRRSHGSSSLLDGRAQSVLRERSSNAYWRDEGKGGKVKNGDEPEPGRTSSAPPRIREESGSSGLSQSPGLLHPLSIVRTGSFDTRSNPSLSIEHRSRVKTEDGFGREVEVEIDLDEEQVVYQDPSNLSRASSDWEEESEKRDSRSLVGTPDRQNWLSKDWENNRSAASSSSHRPTDGLHSHSQSLNQYADGRFVLDEDREHPSSNVSARKKTDRPASVDDPGRRLELHESKRSNLGSLVPAAHAQPKKEAEEDPVNPGSGPSSVLSLHQFLEGDDEEKERAPSVKHQHKPSWFDRTKIALSRISFHRTRPRSKTIVRQDVSSPKAGLSPSSASLSPKLPPPQPALPVSKAGKAQYSFVIPNVEKNKQLLKDLFYQRLEKLIKDSKGIAAIALMDFCENPKASCSTKLFDKLKKRGFLDEKGLPVEPEKLVKCFTYWCEKTVQAYLNETHQKLQDEALEDLFNRCLLKNNESANAKEFEIRLKNCHLMTKDRLLVTKEKIWEIVLSFYPGGLSQPGV